MSSEPILKIEIAAVHELLSRAQAVLHREDYEQLAALVKTLIEMTKLIRSDRATIARLRRMIGQASSEKTARVFDEDHSKSKDEDAKTAETAQSAEDADDVASAKKTGDEEDEASPKGHGRIPTTAYEAAEHIAVPHASLHVGDECPGCACGKLYGLKEPAQATCLFGQAPLVAICWDLERMRCGACGAVYTASAPPQARGPKYSESAASMMALLRYGTGVPLNRLARLQRNLRTPVPATTQWEVAKDRALAIRPVFDVLLLRAANGKVLHNDDTYVRILELMGKRRAKLLTQGRLPDPDRTGLFTTAIVATTGAGPIALFFSGRKHGGENLSKLLEKRTDDLDPPIHMCDALDRNTPKGHAVVGANCLTHGRRHVVDEASSFPAECRHVLELLREVFHNERICKEQALTGDERLRYHQQRSGPIMRELERWMKAELSEKRVEPNSGLGEAFNYLLKRWDKITLFLRVADAPLENNAAERALKKAIQHRNDSLFYRSVEHGHSI